MKTYLGNPELTWEKSKTFDVGLEAGFFNNRLNVEFDFFVKNTDDMIGYHSLPSSQGSPSSILSAKEQASYAQQSYELTSESFQVGKKNTVELITAENTMTSAKQQVLQSKYMALMNLSLLDIYQGKYDIENK